VYLDAHVMADIVVRDLDDDGCVACVCVLCVAMNGCLGAMCMHGRVRACMYMYVIA
jgi:hypothetical protein